MHVFPHVKGGSHCVLSGPLASVFIHHNEICFSASPPSGLKKSMLASEL